MVDSNAHVPSKIFIKTRPNYFDRRSQVPFVPQGGWILFRAAIQDKGKLVAVFNSVTSSIDKHYYLQPDHLTAFAKLHARSGEFRIS